MMQRIGFWIGCIGLFLGLSTSDVTAAEIETHKMILRGVDKITGRVQTIEAEVGKLLHFGNLTIYPERCLMRPPEEAPENSVFLTVTEPTQDQTFRIVFNGWMFSSNPAISAMEHPVYDLWVIACVPDAVPVEQSEISASMMEDVAAPVVANPSEPVEDIPNEQDIPEPVASETIDD